MPGQITYEVIQSRFMMMNTVLVKSRNNVIIFDPGFYEDEVDAIDDMVRGFDKATLIYTHFDYDHIVDPTLAGIDVFRIGSSESLGRNETLIIDEWRRCDNELGIAGDILSDVEEPSLSCSSRLYIQSLYKFADTSDMYGISTLVPGHGNVAANPVEIARRIEKDISYLKSHKEI
jgi:glyoxylase-like metal-dependent hydrolase (beta-lactamase superfamily II)